MKKVTAKMIPTRPAMTATTIPIMTGADTELELVLDAAAVALALAEAARLAYDAV